MLFCLALFVLINIAIAWSNGYSLEEMDWNGNGETTIFEYFEASDIKTREVELGQQICKEFFAMKDGLPVKISCQLPTSIRAELSGFRWKKIGNWYCREYFSLENMQIIEINCHPEVRKVEE